MINYKCDNKCVILLEESHKPWWFPSQLLNRLEYMIFDTRKVDFSPVGKIFTIRCDECKPRQISTMSNLIIYFDDTNCPTYIHGFKYSSPNSEFDCAYLFTFVAELEKYAETVTSWSLWGLFWGQWDRKSKEEKLNKAIDLIFKSNDLSHFLYCVFLFKEHRPNLLRLAKEKLQTDFDKDQTAILLTQLQRFSYGSSENLTDFWADVLSSSPSTSNPEKLTEFWTDALTQ